MPTLSGQIMAAFARAPLVPVGEAGPPAAPGWYGLYRAGDPPSETPLHLAATPDLAATMAHFRAQLAGESGASSPAATTSTLLVRWLAAGPYGGPKARDPFFLTSVEALLLAVLRPEVAAPAQDTP